MQSVSWNGTKCRQKEVQGKPSLSSLSWKGECLRYRKSGLHYLYFPLQAWPVSKLHSWCCNTTVVAQQQAGRHLKFCGRKIFLPEEWWPKECGGKVCYLLSLFTFLALDPRDRDRCREFVRKKRKRKPWLFSEITVSAPLSLILNSSKVSKVGPVVLQSPWQQQRFAQYALFSEVVNNFF